MKQKTEKVDTIESLKKERAHLVKQLREVRGDLRISKAWEARFHDDMRKLPGGPQTVAVSALFLELATEGRATEGTISAAHSEFMRLLHALKQFEMYCRDLEKKVPPEVPA